MKIYYSLLTFVWITGCTINSTNDIIKSINPTEKHDIYNDLQITIATTTILATPPTISSTPLPPLLKDTYLVTATSTPSVTVNLTQQVNEAVIPSCKSPIDKKLWQGLLSKPLNELGALGSQPHSIAVSSNDDIWAITYDCETYQMVIAKINPQKQSITTYATYEAYYTDISDPFLYIAQNKKLWVINLRGDPVLSWYDPSKDQFTSIKIPILEQKANLRYRSNFAEDSQGGFWFQGTEPNFSTLLRYDPKVNLTVAFKIKDPVSKLPLEIKSFLLSENSTMWLIGGKTFRTSDLRIWRFDYKSNSIEDFGSLPTNVGMGLYFMGTDIANDLWIGDSSYRKTEVYKLTVKTKQWMNLGNTEVFNLNDPRGPNGLNWTAPQYIERLKNGEMWTKSSNGLVRYDPKQKVWELIGPGLRDFYEDDKGCVWSTGQGQVWKYCLQR